MQALLFTMLTSFILIKYKWDLFKKESTKFKIKQRNVEYSTVWVYENSFSLIVKAHSVRVLQSRVIKIFTKKKNFNKLYSVLGRDSFISSGIILKNYSDETQRHLKKKTKNWVCGAMAIKALSQGPQILEMDNLFGKKELLLRKLFLYKLQISWAFFKIFYLNFNFIKKPKRRIKRWSKKKYFKLGLGTE